MSDLELADPDFLLKLILVGDSGVGKTNLLSRFTEDEFHAESKSTIGVEFAAKTLRIDEKVVKAQIWDTAGQERYRAVTAAYYRGAVGAIVIYDVTSVRSFQALPQWLTELRDNVDSDVVIVLVGNKTDLAENRVVSIDDGIQFSRQEKLLYIKTSAKDASNVTEIFNLLIGHVVHRLSSREIENDTMSTTLVKPRGIIIAPAPEKTMISCCLGRGQKHPGNVQRFQVIEPPKHL
jgi:small GTP-binding protein